ncbi:response regulator [Pelagicoccus sp. SDUM812003]|uniref:response regulator n=1 Tax=Pelagicoccus sp. SDUM812003 TaxID=3041267 RepID=UPI00280E3125|nr:response regulator [Pelagicoccus sp. SDUM812003]MDQ8203280.1 response regulator [Pelagicoccus sp. SDUM812003]
MKKVLIVEDDSVDQFLARKVINRENPEVQCEFADDGDEALAILTSSNPTPDLVLLDINMPGMNGLSFLEAYNARLDASSSVPIAMLTSSDLESDRQKALSFSNVIEYLTKPITCESWKRLRDSFRGMFND